MKTFQLLGISLRPESHHDILEKIKKYIMNPQGFFQIVSMNPESIVEARQNTEYKKIVETAQIQLVDGAGIVWAGKMLGGPPIARLAGVDLMEWLMKMAGEEGIRTMLIGGSPKVAEELAKCYSSQYPKGRFLGITGIHNIKNPQKEEEKKLFSIVADHMPQIVFVAFGLPAQELWIDRHKKELEGVVCMGVGGSFDYLTGRVGRAPQFVRSLGLEWLYRLVVQPWRWRRQLRLLIFIGLILREKFSTSS